MCFFRLESLTSWIQEFRPLICVLCGLKLLPLVFSDR